MYAKAIINVIVFMLGWSFVFSQFLHASDDTISKLIDKAERMQLSSDLGWISLLHYQRSLGGYKSTILDPMFFYSKNGHSHPDSELKATLSAMLDFTSKIKASDHAQCKFRGRYLWLSEKLDFDSLSVTKISCKEFDDFVKAINSKTVSLIFASAYMNNPSSLFGHTLLRFDREGANDDNQHMLSHAINFGADVPSDALPMSFVFNGIFGGYKGIFTVQPYHQIITLYNNMENRDLWEYVLNFNEKEVNFLIAHIWEIQRVYAGYYFFATNCSYMLLELLDAVRPKLQLAQRYQLYTIPTDTLHEVVTFKNISTQINYRPARGNKIKWGMKHLSDASKKEFLNIALHQKTVDQVLLENSSLTGSDKAATLELAYEYIQYQYMARKIDLKQFRSTSMQLLSVLNKVNDKSNIPAPTTDLINAPQNGHYARRIMFEVRRNDSAEYFYDLHFKPAYHSLLDNTQGFLWGSQLNFFETTLRIIEEGELKAQKISLVNARSLSVKNELFEPTSFEFDIGVERSEIPNHNFSELSSTYLGYIRGGSGASVAFYEKLMGFALIGVDLNYTDAVPRYHLLAGSVTLGVLTSVQNFSLVLDATQFIYTGFLKYRTKGSVRGSYSLSQNFGVEVGYLVDVFKYFDKQEMSVGLKYHF